MLDKLRDGVDDNVDTMAERISQIGGTAFGTLQDVSKKSSLSAYPDDAVTIQAHLQALADRFGAVANKVRANIDEVADAGDATSADVLTEVSRNLDKSLWFVEAHITGKK